MVHPAPARCAPPASGPEGHAAPDPADAELAADEPEESLQAWSVPPEAAGQRLDRHLAERLAGWSRSHLQTLVQAGELSLDGRTETSPARRLRAGQALRLRLVPTPQSQAFQPEAMALVCVHEDRHLLVIDKPAGLVVHPAAGHWSGTLLNGLLAHHAGAAELPRAGIVHRLDKDTSGLMVVAKSLAAQTALVRAIAAREVHREYLALAQGWPAASAFQVDAPIGRDPASRVRMAVVVGGKPARTDVAVLGLAELEGRRLARLRCVLHSGRTHQIRVHLAHRGHPLVADPVYGGTPALGLARQALHARRLAFVHPLDGRALSFEAALPPDLAAAWARSESATLCG